MARYPKGTSGIRDPSDERPEPFGFVEKLDERGTPPAPAVRPMTLQEAAGAFRPLLNAFRGLARMAEATESALTAEQRQREAEGAVERARAELAKVGEDRKLADEGLELARQGQQGLKDATRIAEENLRDIQRQTREEKAALDKWKADAEKDKRATIAANEKEIADTQKRLDAIRAELAEVVKKHAA